MGDFIATGYDSETNEPREYTLAELAGAQGVNHTPPARYSDEWAEFVSGDRTVRIYADRTVAFYVTGEDEPFETISRAIRATSFARFLVDIGGIHKKGTAGDALYNDILRHWFFRYVSATVIGKMSR